MSLESNKKDFEDSLSRMEESIEALEHCVDDSIMETLRSVVNEYNIHFKSDIEEAENSICDMQDMIEQLQDKE